MQQIEVMVNDAHATIIQIDAEYCAFQAQAPLGGRIDVPGSSAAINANYVQTGVSPIGMMISQGRVLVGEIPLPLDKPRTSLILGPNAKPRFTEPVNTVDDGPIRQSAIQDSSTVVQAGPRLLSGGHIVSGSEENFDASVRRRTQQAGIGITDAGKLLFAFVQDETAADLAQRLIDVGAVDAMKCDGGPGYAHLSYGDIVRGYAMPQTALIAAPIPAEPDNENQDQESAVS